MVAASCCTRYWTFSVSGEAFLRRRLPGAGVHQGGGPRPAGLSVEIVKRSDIAKGFEVL
jgi:hypothetical protein